MTVDLTGLKRPSRLRSRYAASLHRLRCVADWVQGLDFTSVAQGIPLDQGQGRAYDYVPSGGAHLAAVLKTLSISASDAILDVGCGKGSAMRTMLQFPFHRVDGIDISPDLAAIAETNFRKLKVNRVRVSACDAAVFTDFDPYSHIYLYHPFPAVVMQKVVKALVAACERRGFGMIVIYNNPVSRRFLLGEGFVLRSTHFSVTGKDIHVYALS
jgi:protein-L-isoaspartate O-methyltransferase